MWEKLKRLIIGGTTVAPFIVSIIWQSIDWILGGRQGPWWEIFKSAEVLVGIVVSTVLFISTLIYYVQHLGALKQLPELKKKLDKVESTGIEAIQTATGFIERAFGLQVMTELRYRHSEAALEALQALGFNLRNWENHVTREQNGKIVLVDDDRKIAVWLRYMRTYYFEEAFDIRRKELVTNGRNFCFILLATLQAFLERLNENETLHYYAVTPVHPKDWYNWPHGHLKPRAYFEEDFIGLFYRTLRETLKSAKKSAKDVGKNLVHGRFLLTSDGVPKGAQPFGWALDDYQSMQIHLKETWMLPVAVPVDKLKNAQCEVLKAFGTYYGWLSSSSRFPGRDSNRLVIPMFSSSWKWQVVEDSFKEAMKGVQRTIARVSSGDVVKAALEALEAQKRNIREAWDVLQHCTSADGGELVKLAEDFHKTQVEEALSQIIAPRGCSLCGNAYEQIRMGAQEAIGGNLRDIPSFIRQVHYYDVLLSEHDQRDKQEKLKLLLQAVLRLQDCRLIPNPRPNPWPKLGEVFGKTLHLPENKCWLVGLDGQAQVDWYQSGVKPEFSFFGISKNNESPEWKLVIATDLDYPFEVAKIKIIEPDDLEWREYAVKINQLYNRQDFTFIELSEVMKQ
jgi:hypothetical protein